MTASKSPKVSVISAVYNTSARLADCLDSILAQTLGDFEIIIVNDGSTDNSPDICREYAEKYPDKIVFLDEPNGGVSVAQNKALDVARGEWVIFCDSDDKIEPGMLEYLYNRAIDNDAQFSTCALICDGSDHEDIRMPYPTDGEALMDREDIIKKMILAFYRCVDDPRVKGYVTLALFKRSIIEQHHIRFISGLQFAEDEAFMLNYLEYVERAAISNKVFYHYILNPKSLCFIFFRKSRYDFGTKEKYWRMLWTNRLNLFRQFGHEQYAPSYLPILFLNTAYHALQEARCDKAATSSERSAKFVKIFNDTLQDKDFERICKAGGLSRKHRIFLFCLKPGTAMTKLFCIASQFASKN